MAKEIQVRATTGLTLYAVILNATGQIWNTAGTPTFETINNSNWTSYAISLTEATSTGLYTANFPTGITTLGTYSILAYRQLGGSAAATDTAYGSESIAWNGSARNVSAKGDSSGFVTVATNNDKTGYTASTVSDKTGYSLSASQSFSTSGSVGSVTGAVGSVTGNVGGNVSGSVASVVGNVGGNVVGTVASVVGNLGGNVVGNVNGNVAGSVGSVTAGVTVSTNNDKTGYTVSTVSDKTGYSLSSSQTFSTSGSVGSVVGAVGSVASGVTVSTNNDKTGYALTAGEHSNVQTDAYNALNQAMPTTPTTGSAFDRIKSYINASLSAIKAVTDQFTFDGSNVHAIVDSAVVVSGEVTVGGYATGQDPASYILATPAQKIDTDASGRVNIGKWLGSVVNSLISGRVPANAQVVGDKTGYTASTVEDKTGYSLSTSQTFNTTGSVGSVDDPVTVDLEQAISLTPTVGTVGEALAAARAQGFGKWAISGTSFLVYGHDGTTVVMEFTLNSATTPTSRTPA